MNRYILYSKEELIARLRAANDALDRGNQTVAGLEPGVRHEFATKSDAELRAIIRELLAALNLLAPDEFPNPAGQRSGVTESVFR